MSSNTSQGSLECYLEEHRALRDEITSQIETMRNFTIVYVSALVSIAGVTLSMYSAENPSILQILLVIPFLSCLLGLVVFFHSRRVSQIGLYIRDELSPSLKGITQDDAVIGWEDYLREKEESRNKFAKWFSITGIQLLTFILPSVLALIFSGCQAIDSSAGIIAIWSLGIVLTVVLSVIVVVERQYWFGRKKDV